MFTNNVSVDPILQCNADLRLKYVKYINHDHYSINSLQASTSQGTFKVDRSTVRIIVHE